MRVFVFVNQVQEIGSRQTTALLIAALYQQGHEVFLADVDGLVLHALDESTRLFAHAATMNFTSGDAADSRAVAKFAQTTHPAMFSKQRIQTSDVILIRTNPGRDLARTMRHQTFLELAKVAMAAGIRLINDPTWLGFYASKASIAVLEPPFRPAMIVSHDPSAVVDFVRNADGQCVLKPLVGSRGNDVLRVSGSNSDLEETVNRLSGHQGVTAQHFVRSSEPGDKRVVVLNGRLIERDGYLAGIHRIPATGDFRANLHAGGTALPLKLSARQREAVEHAAAILYANGIQLAGIDLVGSKVIEFNVFSTGGLYDASQFADLDFAQIVIEQFALDE